MIFCVILQVYGVESFIQLMKNKFTNRGRSLLIGITTISTLLMFYFGFNYLKGINIFDKSNLYFVTFDDLQGIELSSNVILNGYRVGNVRGIDFDYKGLGGAVLTIALDASLELPKGTLATIKSNPLGGAGIVLNTSDGLHSEIIRPRDTISGVATMDMLTKLSDELIPNLNRATLSLDTLIANMNAIASDPSIKETLGEVKASASAIRASSQKMDMMLAKEVPTILDHIEASTKSIAEMAGKLNEADLDRVVKDLSTTVAELKGFISKLNDSEGSIGQLLNDPELYQRLVNTTQSADSLLVDIRNNPKKYVHLSLF